MLTKIQINECLNNLKYLVGNTPVIAINYLYKGTTGTVYAKNEVLNFTGSIKSRMALNILAEAYKKNLISHEDAIVEVTSGNTGIAFAAIGKLLRQKVVIIMPEWMSNERKNIIKAYGAEIMLVSKEEGGFLGGLRLSEKMANEGKVFLPRQFSNKDNVAAHYKGTGPELAIQLAKTGLLIDAFVAGVGTGGTVMGVGNYLKTINKNVKIYPLEPVESPILSTGYKIGSHRIQGISDEFIPKILELNKLNDVISVNDGDAIITAQKMASEIGLAVGISSGANIAGAIKVQQKLGNRAVVTTVIVDDCKKYLSTDYSKQETVKEGYISSDLKFLGIKILPGTNNL
ncbi:MAG: PLP-dependent cysteine synthase family protein [Prevotellaceae bacterium]|jgi:cysteine synthase A|nr:PLP-dependent cysteine synthase family protein [Prevotellaceae bacterium]